MSANLGRRLDSPARYLTLFALLLICYAYFFPRWADWNENSRFDLVRAVVDDHTVLIDRYVANTGDFAYYRGHYYSDKAPGMAFLAVPVYSAFERLTPGGIAARLLTAASDSTALDETLNKSGTGLAGDKVYVFVALSIVTFCVAALPSAILGVVFFWLLGFVGCGYRGRAIATALYALGTSAFPYSASIVGHQTVAALLFVAFALLFAIRRRVLSAWWVVGVGFLLGYAAVTEYQSVLIGAVLATYALLTSRQAVAAFGRLAVGALPPLIALMAYDYIAFGTVLPIGYLHSELWTGVHDVGFVSLTYPHPDALWGITFGVHRGLFFLSPYLLFAVPGFAAIWRNRGRRPEFWVLLLAPLFYFVFNSSSAMWQGGFAVGPRYLVPSLPFLALPAGVGMASIWNRRPFRVLIALTGVWSLFAVWVETIAGQSFPDYAYNPLFDFSLPKLLAGDVARNVGMVIGLASWWSLLPLLAIMIVGTVLLGVVQPSGVTLLAPTSERAEGVTPWA